MNFRTALELPDYPFKMSYEDHILSLGSCFAEHIGNKLDVYKFSSLLNPFGILYNPASINAGLERIIEGRIFTEKDIFQHGELWHSYSHHGHFSSLSQKDTLTNINQKLEEGHEFLKKTNHLILTFGTARVFILKETGKVVANCHKVPGTFFTENRLKIDEIISGFEKSFTKLKERNKDINILLTVSPVRHIREGFIENQRSKAALLLAVEQLCESLEFVHYFPSYELMMDDLRDYRFYEADMAHPNDLAIDYIWKRFSEIFFDTSTKILLEKIEKIVIANKHRSFHPTSLKHQIFLKNQLEQIKKMENQFPFLNFEKEKTLFYKQILR